MSDAKGPTSVRNLLAKFENNNASSTPSPPSRGRSPVGSDHSGSGRPLSKVRASFVAVEQAAQHSPGPPPSGLRKSSDVEEPNATTIDQRLGSPIDGLSAVSTDSVDKPPSSGRARPSPPTTAPAPSYPFESKNANSPSKGQATSATSAPTQKLGDILKGSPFEASPGRKPTNPTAQLRSDSSTRKENEITATTEVAAGEKVPGEMTQKKQGAATAKTTSSRPANLSTTGKDTKAGAKRSPTGTSRPQAATKTTTGNNAVKRDTDATSRTVRNKPSNVRASSQPPVKASTRSKPQPSSGLTNNQGTKASTQNSPRSNKVQPRSPTRPVRLPSSMTSSTAASAGRLNGGTANNARPASRADGNTAPHTRKAPTTKSSSATLRPTSPSNNPAVRKRTSHAALAPSGNTGHDRPRSRAAGDNTRTRGPEESFLARMMRPTASSASKMNERTEVKSPPRTSKTAKPPSRNVSGKQDSQRNGAPRSTTTASPSLTEPHSTGGDASPPKIQEPDIAVEPEAPHQQPTELPSSKDDVSTPKIEEYVPAKEPEASHPPEPIPLKDDALPAQSQEPKITKETETSHQPPTEQLSPEGGAPPPTIQEPDVTEEPETSNPPPTEPTPPEDDIPTPQVEEPDVAEELDTAEPQPSPEEETSAPLESLPDETPKPTEDESPAEEL